MVCEITMGFVGRVAKALLSADEFAEGSPSQLRTDLSGAQWVRIAGAAGSVLDLALDATLQAILARLPASLGAKVAAASVSVVPASDALFKLNSAGTPGATAPATAVQVAGTDGTLQRVVLTDTLGRIKTYADPYTSLAAITPSDSSDLPGGVPRGIICGTGGSLTVITDAVSPVTITLTVFDGEHLPVACIKRVKATGTTATNLVAAY